MAEDGPHGDPAAMALYLARNEELAAQERRHIVRAMHCSRRNVDSYNIEACLVSRRRRVNHASHARNPVNLNFKIRIMAKRCPEGGCSPGEEANHAAQSPSLHMI